MKIRTGVHTGEKTKTLGQYTHKTQLLPKK